MKSTYKARNGHERYRTTRKNRNATATARRRVVLLALEEDLKTGRLRKGGERSKEPMTDTDRKRIMDEIKNIKEKM